MRDNRVGTGPGQCVTHTRCRWMLAAQWPSMQWWRGRWQFSVPVALWPSQVRPRLVGGTDSSASCAGSAAAVATHFTCFVAYGLWWWWWCGCICRCLLLPLRVGDMLQGQASSCCMVHAPLPPPSPNSKPTALTAGAHPPLGPDVVVRHREAVAERLRPFAASRARVRRAMLEVGRRHRSHKAYTRALGALWASGALLAELVLAGALCCWFCVACPAVSVAVSVAVAVAVASWQA